MSKSEYPKEIILSNGDVFTFPEKFKGKHKRNFDRIKIGIEDTSDIVDRYPEMIASLVESAVTKDGKPISLTIAYLDELNIEDYRLLVDEGVDKVIMALNVPKVK